MSFTPAQKRAWWAAKNAKDAKRAANKKPFVPLSNPSPYQLAVFQDMESGCGHTIVDAVAGSGKSTSLLNGLTYIISGLRVCLCAFGRDPADELEDRCPPTNSKVDINTTHSFGGRAIRRRFPSAVLDKHKLQNIVTSYVGDPYADPEKPDEEKSERIEYLSKAVSLSKAWLAGTVDEISEVIDNHLLDFLTESDRKSTMTPEEVEVRKNSFIAEVIQLLNACKRDTTRYDFDDMIWTPMVLNLPMDQFDLILADEVQDFNRCQMMLIRSMLAPGGRIIGFGDERQAIFVWRGADKDSIKNLVEGLGAKRLPLSISYRCAKNVIAYAKSTISGLDHLQASPTAPDGQVNLGCTFDDLKEKVQPGDFILSRLNAPLISLAMHLLINNKKCQILGRDLAGYFRFFIKKSRAETIPEFLDWVQKWQEDQMEMLQQRKRKPKNLEGMIENIQDRANCMLMLAQDCYSLKALHDKLRDLFTDDTSNKTFIALSTVHRAKGSERDNVWMLNSTFKPGKSTEEDNIVYVAVTRAKHTLNVVEGQLRDKN